MKPIGSQANPHRKLKLENRITLELNQFLRSEVSDPRLTFVSITHVELNKDYHYGKVYWDTFDTGKRGDIKSALENAAPRLRSKLASILPLQQVPKLEYFYDSQVESEHNIERLLNEDAFYSASKNSSHDHNS